MINIKIIELSISDYKLSVEVVQKNIKNIYIKVSPPDGYVRISAPKRMELDVVKDFAVSKIEWIIKHRNFIRNQKKYIPKKYLTREIHEFRGNDYLLKVIECDSPPKVLLTLTEIELYVRPNATVVQREKYLNKWYRAELNEIIPNIIAKWENKIGVKSSSFSVKKMRTRWGTCNIKTKKIWLNLELAKKTVECLEYVVLHELVHLLERKHNSKFVGYMNRFMPDWKVYKKQLNKL